jgi:VanZ family protein
MAETLQLFLPERYASVLDVLTNTAGAALGAAAITIAIQIAQAMRRQKSYVGLPAAAFAIAYLSAAVAEALIPLQGAAVIALRSGSKLHRLHTAARLDWSSLGDLPFADFVLFFPLGIFGVMALVEGGASRWAAVWRISGWGALSAILLELIHGPLGQPILLGAAVVHLLAVVLGAVACGLWLPAFSRQVRGRGRPALLLIVYALLIAFWAWRPFEIETDPVTISQQFAPDRLIPLQGLGSRGDPASIAEIVKPFFLMFPLGALLAVWPLRRSGFLGYCLPALYLAAVTECAQGFIAGRFFDGTDLVVQCAAAAIGWAVARRAGYEPHGAIFG